MRRWKTILAACCGALVLHLTAVPAEAGVMVTYWSSPTDLLIDPANSLTESYKGSAAMPGSRVLADDFIPAHSGYLHGFGWFGSKAVDGFEVVFYEDDPTSHVPAAPIITFDFLGFGDYGNNYGSQDFYQFSVRFSSDGPFLEAGTTYWFSVASLSPGWYWAEAKNPPNIGSETFDAQRSGLFCEPFCVPTVSRWDAVPTDLAFFVTVPEPGSLALATVALALLAVSREPCQRSCRGIRAAGSQSSPVQNQPLAETR